MMQTVSGMPYKNDCRLKKCELCDLYGNIESYVTHFAAFTISYMVNNLLNKTNRFMKILSDSMSMSVTAHYAKLMQIGQTR